MLLLVRERVLAVDSNKLYIPTAVFEDLDGPMPLHGAALWPEHASLKFTFAHSQHSELQYFVTADSLRPEMPSWCAPKMPVAVSRSLKQPPARRSTSTSVTVTGITRARRGIF